MTRQEQRMQETNANMFKAWNDQNFDLMRSISVPGMTTYLNGDQTSADQSGYEEFMNLFLTAIPDLKFTLGNNVFTGNKSYTEWTSNGTNTGNFQSAPPTGKQHVTKGITIATYNDEGKITREDIYFDNLSYLEAWGYELSPPDSGE